MDTIFLPKSLYASFSGKFYVSGVVAAEMKKTNTYCVRIIIEGDGNFTFSSCECPAGAATTGHCKHCMAVAYCIEHFVRTGNWKIRSGCTEELQTWHKPSKSKNAIITSPMKAEDITIWQPKFGEVEKQNSKCQIYDPRPLKY